MKLVNDINESDNKPHTFSDSAINAAGEGSDWQSATLRNGPIQNHEISVPAEMKNQGILFREIISGNRVLL
jgi:hypothetical protein